MTFGSPLSHLMLLGYDKLIIVIALSLIIMGMVDKILIIIESAKMIDGYSQMCF